MVTLRPILALVGLLATASAAPAQVTQGDMFPALSAAGLTGALPDTAGKVVLVDFWASWCAPCKASFPAYSRIQADYAAKGLVVVAVGVDDSSAAFAAFVRKMKPGFATVHDASHKLVAQVQVPTMPTSYIVDRSGKVRFMHAGFRGSDTEREIRKELDQVLGAGSSPQARRALMQLLAAEDRP